MIELHYIQHPLLLLLLLSHFRCFNYTFCFEIIVDSQAVYGNNTERPQVPFTCFLQVVTSCNPMIEYHRQDIDISTVNIRAIPSPQISFKLSLHSRNKSCLVMVLTPFYTLLDLICQYFIEIFFSLSLRLDIFPFFNASILALSISLSVLPQLPVLNVEYVIFSYSVLWILYLLQDFLFDP